MSGRLCRIALFALALAIPAVPAQAAPAPYRQPLPIPPVAQPAADGVYDMRLTQLQQQVHPDLPPTTVWGYSDGHSPPSWPGPTMLAERGERTDVRWLVDLPEQHLLPLLDPTMPDMPHAVRALTHLHGAFVSAGSDGNPFATDALFSGETQAATYTNGQPATTLFYHDHAHGTTRLNVYAGLAGGYLLRDAVDTGREGDPLDVPGGAYELPLVLQDRSFTADGQLFYTAGPEWIPEFFGDVAVVNGAIQPYTDVEPRSYRLHLVNGSNARIYNLSFSGLPITQIGSDGGLLRRPAMSNRLLLHPGERADVVIDFSSRVDEYVTMKDNKLPAGVVSPGKALPGGMLRFRVGDTVTDEAPVLPATLPVAEPDLPAPSRVRDLTLEEELDAAGEPVRLVIDGKPSMAAVDIEVEEDAVEDWRFINLTADTHPMHMHLQQYQVIKRRPFDAAAYGAALDAFRAGDRASKPKLADYWTGPAEGPRPAERGWKDTAGADPGEVLRVRARFDLPAGARGAQLFALHCHILEHEDNDMMRPFRVG